MGITLTFESFEDMTAYARQLLGVQPIISKAQEPVLVQQTAPAYQQPVQSAPVQQAPINTNPINQQPAYQQPAQTNQQPGGPAYQTPVQTTPQSYTKDDLAKAAMTLMDAGRQPDLLNLLAQFGVDSLPAIPPEQYGAFATALRGLGAQI